MNTLKGDYPSVI